MRTVVILFFLLNGWSVLPALAQEQVSFNFTSLKQRAYTEAVLQRRVQQTIKLPFNREYFEEWKAAFWAMELMLYKPFGYEKQLPHQIRLLPAAPPDVQRSFLEMLYTLYARRFVKELKANWQELANARNKAIALEYLALAKQFPHIPHNDLFRQTLYYQAYQQNWNTKPAAVPSKQGFLSIDFLPGQVLLCSFQSANRNKPGYLMIRTANGTWMKDNAGVPLRFPQLARAISNLPYYITNGNTPQGLFKITGTDSSTNQWIGPTTNLQLLMPFENGTQNFFGADTAYEKFYDNLLGPFAGAPALKESFVAGKIGRSEIIAHGTTINPSWYKEQTYFPNTPSLGCLCSPETWDEKGRLIYSAQQQWINVVKQLDPQPLYLLVVNVKDL